MEAVLRAVGKQVERIVVVDNGSSGALVANVASLCSRYNATFIELSENRGIASAQNTGIAELIRNGSDYVLLLDHDSVPFE
ncbi:glycosyltransferase, partial [Achromobacter sp. SIMBA_011]|uniref:glycosyltransferase n=1 Tax=Achromobacter sp. SIMBA_011 TaxID=3085759 RepID=UPI00397D9422